MIEPHWSFKEQQFGLLAGYKNLLERTIVLPRLVTRATGTAKSKENRLLEKLDPVMVLKTGLRFKNS